ncbi:MAG: hypothetical protein IPH20_20320 [Bacteroidales bacterium]|nr:hypothetical protein [Bacteroidales bacterium]
MRIFLRFDLKETGMDNSKTKRNKQDFFMIIWFFPDGEFVIFYLTGGE